MHKLIIVGHQSSNFQDTFKLLQSYGVNAAKPSRREGYTPPEISSIICQAHGLDENSVASALEQNFSQLDVGKVWHGLALDLMLGNLDSKVWGWTDTKSVYLLNFWRDLDPEITFVLVYSNPEDVLLNSGQDSNLTAEDLESEIEQWIAYNEALLHFYNRNKDRCFLVHSQQVNEPSNRYLLEISSKINVPLLEKISSHAHQSGEQAQNVAQVQPQLARQINHVHQFDNDLAQAETAVAELVNEITPYETDLKQKPLSLFLSKLIIQQHPKLIQLYEDLQSFANFPFNGNATGFQQQNFNQSVFDAWLEMTSYLNKLQQTEEEATAILQENAELMSKLEQLEKQDMSNASKLIDLDETKAQVKKLQGDLKKLDALPELEQENSTLLLQLHHVQEELERYYLENQAYKAQVNNKPKVLEYSAEQIKNQLAYRLGGLMIKNSKTVLGFVFMPITLMRESRRYKQEKLKMPKYEKKTLSEYEKNQLSIVKSHLSYRLGSTLLSNIRNPLNWLALPYRLWREISLYKKMRS